MLRVLYAVRMVRSSYPSKERVFFFFFFNFELNFFFNGNKELPRATYLRSVSSPNLTSESIGVCINLLSAKCILWSGRLSIFEVLSIPSVQAV